MNESTVLALAVALAFLLGLLVGLAVWIRARSSFVREDHARHREHEQVASALREEVAALRQAREADAEKLGWSEKAEERLREAFTALAGETLRKNADSYSSRAKEDIQGVLTPFQEKLVSLDGHVRELEKARAGAYESLNSQIRDLKETHRQLHESTTNLRAALKSPTARGRWGEVQLRRVVEMAGLERHVDFDEQSTEAGEGRPDMVARLPGGGVLPIDAKVPLNAYLSAMETENDDERRRQLAAHAQALKSRVRELSTKAYWDQFDATPGFVVMFVPNEACLGAAFQEDAGLFEYATERKVLICSPVNLYALLKAVAFGWQQQEITDNAREIAAQGQELYSRLGKFVDMYSDIGRHLQRSVSAFNKATGSLDSRLVPAMRRFRELGIGTDGIEEPSRLDITTRQPSLLEGTDSEE
ncbi:MAG: DNA recombination protein RmuC [marine benthic group bacterium]|nr:DNA recombination protein RmuC [Candidatus Carthagonibacter metallireducens]MCL7973981.1 DNA recombination protein RmuC [Gemmatimonadota bacterium]